MSLRKLYTGVFRSKGRVNYKDFVVALQVLNHLALIDSTSQDRKISPCSMHTVPKKCFKFQ